MDAKARHILYVIDQLDSLDGGAERSLLLTTRLLPVERYRATVVTFKEPLDQACLRQFPCPVHVLPLNRTYDWNAAKAALRLRRLIRRERVELVQTFFESADLWGGLVSKLSGWPMLISSRRDMGFRRRLKHKIGYRLLGWMFDRIHTVSETVREYAIRADHVSPSKVITVPNGVFIEASSHTSSETARSRFGLDSASHVVVEATTVRPVKGLDLLVHAAAMVCRQFPKAMFVVAGGVSDREYFDKLNGLVRELGLLSNFRFLGSVHPISPLLRLCNVFCHLSRSDGLSNAVLEAMACGLPCVVSRAGGNAEIIRDAENGFLVPIENPELAADRISALLRDPGYARSLGERGRKIVEANFTADMMVSRLVDLYDQLLDVAPRNARLATASTGD
ncbi:MAG: glycosyltransferase family 4 protein [Acidobacteria bacterium]|nr:glycosyltransferase family 4 protein [Acidobacteriota bacterium]